MRLLLNGQSNPVVASELWKRGQWGIAFVGQVPLRATPSEILPVMVR